MERLCDPLTGKAVGESLCHVWYEDGKYVRYNGKIVEVHGSGEKRSKRSKSKTFDDAVDYETSLFALGADFIFDDMVLSD